MSILTLMILLYSQADMLARLTHVLVSGLFSLQTYEVSSQGTAPLQLISISAGSFLSRMRDRTAKGYSVFWKFCLTSPFGREGGETQQNVQRKVTFRNSAMWQLWLNSEREHTPHTFHVYFFISQRSENFHYNVGLCNLLVMRKKCRNNAELSEGSKVICFTMM